MNVTHILGAVMLWLLCVLFRQPLESHPITHVLVQLPALAWCGWLLARNSSIGLSVARQSWNQGGFAALLAALFLIIFWMLPNSIDAALTKPNMNVFKYLSVPLGVGAALATGWPRAHPILKGFLKANAISMLAILAFLYTHAPVRICNAYLVVDQEQLGYGFLYTAIGLSILWTAPLVPPQQERRLSDQHRARQEVFDAK